MPATTAWIFANIPSSEAVQFAPEVEDSVDHRVGLAAQAEARCPLATASGTVRRAPKRARVRASSSLCSAASRTLRCAAPTKSCLRPRSAQRAPTPLLELGAADGSSGTSSLVALISSPPRTSFPIWRDSHTPRVPRSRDRGVADLPRGSHKVKGVKEARLGGPKPSEVGQRQGMEEMYRRCCLSLSLCICVRVRNLML